MQSVLRHTVWQIGSVPDAVLHEPSFCSVLAGQVLCGWIILAVQYAEAELIFRGQVYIQRAS